MTNKYLTPSPSELYQAPRGGFILLDQLDIARLSRINAMIDSLNDNNNIGESQALEIFQMARITVAESVTLN